MKAVVWHGKEDVRVDQLPDPTIEEPTDAPSGGDGVNGDALRVERSMASWASQRSARRQPVNAIAL